MSNELDVVLMDVYLDGCRDGIEAGRWVHEVCDVPVVFITAFGDRDTLDRVHEMVQGAPVLQKPMYRKRLAETLSQISAAQAA
jgi:response regulator of citrate/malate metabolism